MIRRLFCAALLFSWADRCVAAEPVWIDTDVSIGSPLREVDDAFALVLAFHSRELRVTGISTSYGNAPLSYVDRVAREMTTRFGPSANLSERNVFSGSRSARDLGRATAASNALASVLRKQRLTYIAIGPLTNLGTVLQLHPELAHRIKHVVFLGGTLAGEHLTFGRNNALTIHDANVVKDKAAAAVVLRSGVPVVLVPISTAGKLMVDANDLTGVAAGGPAGAYLAKRSKVWLWFWQNLARAEGGPLFDTVPVMATVKPHLVFSDTRYASVEQDGTLFVSKKRTAFSRPVRYCPNLGSGIKAVLLRRLQEGPRKVPITTRFKITQITEPSAAAPGSRREPKIIDSTPFRTSPACAEVLHRTDHLRIGGDSTGSQTRCGCSPP